MAIQMKEQSTPYLEGRPEEGFEPYRSVSKAAVSSLCLGLLTLVGLLFPAVLAVGLIGFLLGIIGYRNTRRFPDELTGKTPAIVGTVLCCVVAVAGTAMHLVIYATEVPEGYERVAFSELKARSDGADVPPPEVLDLDGKKVFIKGYVYPDGQKEGIKQFVLVPDMGTCCFGGQPKLTHMIEVSLVGALSIDYNMRKRGIAGILKVDPNLKPVDGLGGVYYRLIADLAK
jgi:hypothetical protein